MRGLRSRILRTLQSFPNAVNVQPGLLLPAPDVQPSPPPPPKAPCRSQEEQPDGGGGGGGDDKENVSPEVAPRKAKKMRVSLGAAEDEAAACYRRPDPATATLFDPDLLAAFRGAVDAYARALQEAKRRDDDDDDGFFLLDEEEGCGVAGGVGFGVDEDPLEGFETRCPPGGERAVVLYTTSLRGVRKTFEDCATVRRLLEGLRVAFLERDVSMHAPYRDELRALLVGLDDAAVPPRLFVDGRYLGGANEVVTLHEQARLRPVLRRAPRRGAGDAACAVCGGAWFVVCGACSGSHRLYDAAAAAGGRVPCTGCNENGLVPCPLCS